MVRARLDSDRRAGKISSAVDPTATAVVLTSMVERSIAVVFSADTGISDDVLADSLGRAIWLVVYGDAPRATP